jgi:hypothetical protein
MSPSEEKIQAFFKGIGNKWFKENQKNTKYETLTIKLFSLFIPDRMSQLIVQEVCIRLKQLTVSWLLAAVGM